MNVTFDRSRYTYDADRSEDESEGDLEGLVVPDDYVSGESDGEMEAEKTGGSRKRKRYGFREQTVQRSAESRSRPMDEIHDRDALGLEAALHSPALTVLGEEPDRNPVVGREKEARRIMEMILQPRGGVRPLLLGPAGVGKKAVVEKVADLFKTTFKDHPFGNRRVICLDCNELLANCVSQSIAETVSGELQFFSDNILRGDSPPILYFRNIDKILQLDQVAEFVQSLLKKDVPFIASISEDPKDEKVAKAISVLSALNFEGIEIDEAPHEDVLQITTNFLDRNPLHENLFFTAKAVDLGVRLAEKYIHTMPLPVKAINLIQESANQVLLSELQKKAELDKVIISPEQIAAYVSLKTGIPPEDLMDESVFNEERFVERFRTQIIGQDLAISTVCQRVACYKMGLLDPNKPWGVFLFVGPTGVGKTELARSLARFLFNDEKSLICIDGSEYKESHTLSNLIGSPLGYEGHETGGLLTDPLLKNPHQVVLLDEFEKFHEDVRRLFLQVFDRGTLTDRRGKRVDCTNALFIMTSNLGSEKLFEMCDDKELNADEVGKVLKPILVENLSPELCNRFTAVVPFQPMKKTHLHDLVIVQLNRIKERLASQARIDLDWSSELVEHFEGLDVDLRFGMRDFCRLVDSEVVRELKKAGSLSDQRLHGKVTLAIEDHQVKVEFARSRANT